ncbi:Zcchc10 [Symbiodinium natans]|uniref:Zcchc10 protein n=1 Tax=Symbiodinium natans TaxID=878477 RepID=A0A812LDL9_9DINO|nr:Zcchc10 [Symbiodinium natans]
MLGILSHLDFKARPFCFSVAGASAAVNKAKIICQQCLAPGHWTYECKNGSTYQVRASASRQLKQKRFKQAFLEEEAHCSDVLPCDVFRCAEKGGRSQMIWRGALGALGVVGLWALGGSLFWKNNTKHT